MRFAKRSGCSRESTKSNIGSEVTGNKDSSILNSLGVDRYRFAHIGVALAWAQLSMMLATGLFAESPNQQDRIRDRLWLWTHPAGSYNNDFIKNRSKKSSIEPVDAVQTMGLKNAYFIRYKDVPAIPFDAYYVPFKQLNRVTWSLTGASGVTSAEERKHVLELAEKNKNITNFIMDDFFHHTCHLPLHWLAEKNVTFPVTLTLRPERPTVADQLRLVQSDWHTKDYRSKGFVVETSADGNTFDQVASGELPNEAAAFHDVPLPEDPFVAIRIRLLNTHDAEGSAQSCGLRRVELRHDSQLIGTDRWRGKASSQYIHHIPWNVVADEATVPMPASLTPEQLAKLRGQLELEGRRIPLHVVVYTHQLVPRAAHHLRHVDAITMWTWAPVVLKDLEDNLTRLEQLAPGKEIILGCYMYDFYEKQPLPVDLMKQQTELGYEWLREGRIQGMIFLASPICDLDLESVEWTRAWIHDHGDELLPIHTP